MRDDDGLDGRKAKPVSEIGGDLSTWSVGDIDERIDELEAEIARLKSEKKNKQGSMSAAEAFFKSSK